MLHPTKALEEILARIEPLSELERVPLTEASGRALGEPAVSDVDLPPFEKSMMDGYAVRSEDLAQPGSLACIGESRAGQPFDGAIAAGPTTAIYTGAQLPSGADAVEQIERTSRDGDSVHFEAAVPEARHVSHLERSCAASARCSRRRGASLPWTSPCWPPSAAIRFRCCAVRACRF